MSRTDLMRLFDNLKSETRDRLKDIEIKAKQALKWAEELPIDPDNRILAIRRIFKDIIEKSE